MCRAVWGDWGEWFLLVKLGGVGVFILDRLDTKELGVISEFPICSFTVKTFFFLSFFYFFHSPLTQLHKKLIPQVLSFLTFTHF